MALALKKATDEDLNTLYDIEDIYEWIDYVRSMGGKPGFLKMPMEENVKFLKEASGREIDVRYLRIIKRKTNE